MLFEVREHDCELPEPAVPETQQPIIYTNLTIPNTQTFQINDARQLPIIIPSLLDIDEAQRVVNDALLATKEGRESKLHIIQKRVDEFVEHLYLI